MNQTSFTLVPFDNRTGSQSWRLTGWLNGVRIRRNFKTREEAAAEKASLELKALHATSGLRVVATALREDQLREAEALFKRLEGKSQPLSFYVDFALTNYLEPEQRNPLQTLSGNTWRPKSTNSGRDTSPDRSTSASIGSSPACKGTSGANA